MSPVRVMALVLVLGLAGVVLYVMWPPAPPPDVVQTAEGRSMMRDLEAQRQLAAQAGLVGGAALPALFADGQPLPELTPAPGFVP